MPSTQLPAPRMDKAMAAVMIAGMCTFLNVYPTQPLLPYLRQIFHASELQVSLTVSATIVAVALTSPFVGVLAERIGRKKVIVPSLLLLSIPTALAAISTSLHALIFWRFMQGVFVPGVVTVLLAYISEEWEGRGVGRAMAAYVSGSVMGGFLGRFLSGVIATHWNWRATFVVLAAINFTGALLVRSWLPLAKNFVKAEHFAHALADAMAHLRNPRMLANFGTGAAILFTLVGTFTYANFYLAAPPFHLNPAQLGSIFFVYLLGVVVTPISGKFLDYYGFRHTAYLYCALMVAGQLLTLIRSLIAVIAGLAIFSTGVFIAQAAATVQNGAIAGRGAPGERRARRGGGTGASGTRRVRRGGGRGRSSAAGLYITFYYLGGGLGATVTDWFWQRAGWSGCAALFVAMAFVSLGMAIVSSRPADQLHSEEAEVVAD